MATWTIEYHEEARAYTFTGPGGYYVADRDQVEAWAMYGPEATDRWAEVWDGDADVGLRLARFKLLPSLARAIKAASTLQSANDAGERLHRARQAKRLAAQAEAGS